MFSEFVEAQAGEAGRRSWAIVVSTIVQAMCLLVMLLAPLVYTRSATHGFAEDEGLGCAADAFGGSARAAESGVETVRIPSDIHRPRGHHLRA